MEKWVQRYEIRYAHDITQKADGTFVTYEAYKQLQTKIEQQQEHIRKTLEVFNATATHHGGTCCLLGVDYLRAFAAKAEEQIK